MGRCVDLAVPQFINRREAELNARVVAHLSGGDEVLPGQRRVLRVVIKNLLIFVRTDKPVYTPGQHGKSTLGHDTREAKYL